MRGAAGDSAFCGGTGRGGARPGTGTHAWCFPGAELYLSPIGDGTLVVYECDGKALAADEGPLALVPLKDTRPGPRHVKWLQSIELRVLDP